MKIKKIGFYVSTSFIVVLMMLTGVMDISRTDNVMQIIRHLGYPDYFPLLLGAAKILGAIALAVPKFPRLKEWAYAGLF